MTKNACFGQNVAVFGSKSFVIHISENHLGISFTLFFWWGMASNGPEIPFFMGVNKSFGTNITENHFGNLSALFFGHALDQVGQKCRYLAPNASFGPNLAVFGPKIQGFGGHGVKLLVPSYHNDIHDKDDNQDEELAAPGQDCLRSCRHRKGREASRSCAGLRRLMSNIIVVMFDDDEEVFSKSGLQPFLPSSFEGFDRLAL